MIELTLPEIVKRKLDVVNVDQNIENQTVYHVHLVILGIQTAAHVNVILMEPKAISANHRMRNVHAK